MKVADIYCHDITSASEYMKIRTVIRMMMLSRYNAIPVVNIKNDYIGCIDICDIIDNCIPQYMKSLTNSAFLPDTDVFYNNLEKILDDKIKDYLPDKYPTVEPNDTLSYAADLLMRSGRPSLPVVENHKLKGFLSRLEILTYKLRKKEA